MEAYDRLVEMTWLQARSPGAGIVEARTLAHELVARLDSELVRSALGAIAPVGGTSHQVDAVVRPHAAELGFTSQKKNLFFEYPIALRPDW